MKQMILFALSIDIDLANLAPAFPAPYIIMFFLFLKNLKFIIDDNNTLKRINANDEIRVKLIKKLILKEFLFIK